MLTNVLTKVQTSLTANQASNSTPVVALFTLFEPKMTAKNEITHKLQLLVNEAEQKLIKNFPFAAAEPVLKRLKSLVKNLDYSTHKKSVALYVSAKGEKIFYLDMPLAEKVMVDTSFNIRLLAAAKKKLPHYIVLALGTHISRVYFNNGKHLVSMFTSTCKKSTSEYAASVESFLKKTDNNLGIILNYFPSLPVFIVGNAFTLNKYKIVTQNEAAITQLIEVNADELTADAVKTALQPYITNWEDVQAQYMHHALDNALNNGRIAVGIENVVKAARQRRARLLVMDKNYTFPLVKEKQTTDGAIDDSLFTDAVDEVIERVLLTGGDVVLADKEVLKDYQHIALVY